MEENKLWISILSLHR